MQTLDPNTPWNSEGEMTEAAMVRDSRGNKRMASDSYYRECWEAKTARGWGGPRSSTGHYDQSHIPGGQRSHASVTFGGGSTDGVLNRSGYAQVIVSQGEVAQSHRDLAERRHAARMEELRPGVEAGDPASIGIAIRLQADHDARPNPNGPITPYRNREEMLADMGRPEYRSHIDPSWREHVEARIAATS